MSRRLDVYAASVLETRARAQDAIKAGRVRVNGKVITKPAYALKDTDVVEIETAQEDFVSRAAWKLKGALEAWNIDLQDKVVLDIGASTGGFTDVCLQKGAKKVYALDVGHLQLADRLKEDARVVEMEGRNARYMEPAWFDSAIDFACMDVSFISAKTILEHVFAVMDIDELVVLIKPQFECGPAALNDKGVLKNEKIRQKILDDMLAFGLQHYEEAAIQDSTLAGRSGNLEALLHLKKKRNKIQKQA